MQNLYRFMQPLRLQQQVNRSTNEAGTFHSQHSHQPSFNKSEHAEDVNLGETSSFKADAALSVLSEEEKLPLDGCESPKDDACTNVALPYS